ncbi:MAG: hypothetical protein SFW66_04660 [Gammaproteobacteria bacterium]|nr:hypothetical protein [Gammaproteobacteria bacterium]
MKRSPFFDKSQAISNNPILDSISQSMLETFDREENESAKLQLLPHIESLISNYENTISDPSLVPSLLQELRTRRDGLIKCYRMSPSY